jgi:hypothetical protein
VCPVWIPDRNSLSRLRFLLIIVVRSDKWDGALTFVDIVLSCCLTDTRFVIILKFHFIMNTWVDTTSYSNWNKDTINQPDLNFLGSDTKLLADGFRYLAGTRCPRLQSSTLKIIWSHKPCKTNHKTVVLSQIRRYLTNSMPQNSPYAHTFSLWTDTSLSLDTNLYYRSHKHPPLDYSEPTEYSPQFIPYFSQIYFNTAFPSTFNSSECSSNEVLRSQFCIHAPFTSCYRPIYYPILLSLKHITNSHQLCIL